ncbi:DUF5132 domain-containing protein [Kitasatospora sp. HPMI-4]|uniref:DUF5132 domain-containing protein n=1 Tax=Kitasatospora sp. HPMI-4 TaxID=3448443 RepID=UPI003F1B7F15
MTVPPAVPSFLVGLVVSPLAKRIVRPLARGVLKTSVEVVMDVKKCAKETRQELQGIAAEAAAEMRPRKATNEAVRPEKVEVDSGDGGKTH